MVGVVWVVVCAGVLVGVGGEGGRRQRGRAGLGG